MTAATKLKDAYSLEEKLWPTRQHIKKQRHYFVNKGLSSQGYGFSSSHVWMWELDYIKKAECQRIHAFELWYWRSLLRVPWTARRSNQSTLKAIRPEYSLEGLMLKLKLRYSGPPDVKNWLIGKDPDAGKVGRQEKKETIEDEMVGWHHQLDGYELELAQACSQPRVGCGQGRLICCCPWGHKKLDTTEQLNWTEVTSSGSSSEGTDFYFLMEEAIKWLCRLHG